MSSENTALKVSSLSVSYGNVVAVHDATFTVAKGDACAITGPNGTGKSSILMGVTGMVRRRGGVEIFGAPAPSGDVRWAARHGLTLVPERRQLYPDLSAADNIILGCYAWTKSIGRARKSPSFGKAIELFPELKPHLKQAAGSGRPLTRYRLSTPSAPTMAKSPTARLRMFETRYQTATQTANMA